MNLLSAKEAARRLGLAGSTLTRWCIQGRVPGAVKVANMWLVPEESLDKIDRPAMGRPFNEKEDPQE